MRVQAVASVERAVSASRAVADALEDRGFLVGDGLVVAAPALEGQDAPKTLVVNPQKAVRLAASTEEASLLLRLHGIPVAPDQLPSHVARPVDLPSPSDLARVYVDVADLTVLRIEEDGKSALRGMSEWRRTRMQEAACRAVYLLGLHFGRVVVEVHPKGRWHVHSVDPDPPVDPDLGAAYGEAASRLATLVLLPASLPASDPVLGADPEFALATHSRKLLFASNYVTHGGRVGYDRQSRAHRGSVFPLAELRPDPSPSPLVLANNVRAALKEARRRLPVKGASWLAGSYPLGRYPTGGHLHISGLPLSTPVLAALDNFLALPVMLLEQKKRAKHRRRKYGRLGDFRLKRHGGFEYRALPSWIVSPKATLAVLCLAKVIATEWRSLQHASLAPYPSAKEFYYGKKARFRKVFGHLWHRIMETPTARRYDYELAYIEQMVQSGREWEDDRDIKAAWWPNSRRP